MTNLLSNSVNQEDPDLGNFNMITLDVGNIVFKLIDFETLVLITLVDSWIFLVTLIYIKHTNVAIASKIKSFLIQFTSKCKAIDLCSRSALTWYSINKNITDLIKLSLHI